MNKNRSLKVVWLIGSVAILLLFCTQAYWLISQYQYSLDKRVEQFQEDCNSMLKEDLRKRKFVADRKAKKGREHVIKMKIENSYDSRKDQHGMTTITYWDREKFLGRICEPDITSDDAYEMCSRYLASRAKKPSLAVCQASLRKKGYDEITDFREIKYKKVFLEARYAVQGKWEKSVVVNYQTNPILHEGISFVVPISAANILKSMLWQLVGSVLFFLILASCLYYLVKTIVFQKRIDALRHEFLKNMIYEMKQPAMENNADESAISIGIIDFYYGQNELRMGNDRVIITSRQAEILKLLATHQNQLVERETILNEVWGDDSYSNSLALNVQITYLRRALSLDAAVSIEPVIKKGYILKVDA